MLVRCHVFFKLLSKRSNKVYTYCALRILKKYPRNFWWDRLCLLWSGFVGSNPLFWLLLGFRWIIINPSLTEDDNSTQKLLKTSLQTQLGRWKPHSHVPTYHVKYELPFPWTRIWPLLFRTFLFNNHRESFCDLFQRFYW